jgi:hypothetical protein
MKSRSRGAPRNVAVLLLSSIAALISLPTHAVFGLGGGESGAEFNYEACARIVEGKTTYQEAEALLGAEPISTGKNAVGFFRLYQYEKQGGGGISAFGVNVGGVKAKSYKCYVVHNNEDVIVSVDMEAIGADSKRGGL